LKGTLGEKARAPDSVLSWLNAVRTAETLDEALTMKGKMKDGQSVITPNGEWLGPGWVRIARGTVGRSGMLEREKSIELLQASVEELEKQLKALEKKSGSVDAKISVLGGKTQTLHESINQLHRSRNELEGRLNSGRANKQMLDERQKTLGTEAKKLKKQIADDQAKVSQSRGKLEKMLEQMAELHKEREVLEARRPGLIKLRDDARAAVRESQNERHELALKTGARSASLDSLRQSLARMDTQLSQVQQRFVNLSEQIARVQSPEKEHAGEMEELLQRRVKAEKELAGARQKVQELEEEYRQQDAARQASVQLADERRTELERARLQQQEIELNTRALSKQIEDLGGDAEKLAEEIPDDADSEAWQEDIERMQLNITRMEPVNLAAIQEFEEEKKRKDYLDEQNDDLCEALATLENAIAKIDRKTRTRFKDTFERVNKGVQELFPRLFGGGHGYLELTGEDLLTTGVGIMARPPGKRVSSIHLLSGGEKALTAVAFVFAIFRLNPAPFCLLDEVDAPLDDANVARFCSMVTEMAETVQFIFVTHNKITMEMAQHMSGVTMREPGVSRLVQVDIDEAARMAAS
jgi:chromosome segregation protein